MLFDMAGEILPPAQPITTVVGPGSKEAHGANDSPGVSVAQGEVVKRWGGTCRCIL